MNEEFQRVLDEKPHMQIGKSGFTPGQLEHIKQLFKHQKILKIKILADAAKSIGIETILQEMLTHLRIFILDVRGFTIIISKRKIPGIHVPKKYRQLVMESQKNNEEPLSEPDTQSLNQDLEVKTESDSESDTKSDVEVEPESEPEPDFIDYDDEALLRQIDDKSDEIYGAPPKHDRKKKFSSVRN
jgi:RNA-binding protein YhbY